MFDLDYTGHPIFDVGLAAIVAYAEKEYPAELDEEDLDRVAVFIEEYYTRQPLTSFLTTSLMNSDFTQPAFEKKPERRLAYAHLVARSFGEDVPQSEEICVFTGKPALGYSLSLKRDKDGREGLPPGRAFRQHIPLITGESIINFSPWGDQGLPVSGEALLCLQFFPMGCRKCAGRLLAVHSDNPDILLAAAQEALKENISAITLAHANGETKLPDASSSAPSLLIETIVAFTQRQERALRKRRPYAVTAYHLTNSGQSSPLDEKSPPLKIYHLPMNLIRFLQAANHPDHKATWNRLVMRGQERLRPAKNTPDTPSDAKLAIRRRRNFFYEDLFRLPEQASAFLRKHFWLIPDLRQKDTHPFSQTGEQEKPFIPWTFIALFLQEVLFMEKERIEEIKKLGDSLAAYVKEFDDQRFLNEFYSLQRSDFFRNTLLRAAKRAASQHWQPLFRYDVFRSVFFTPDGDELRFDWKLARDLLFLRMLEWLYDHDEKVGERVTALPEERDSDNADLAYNN
ncbi:MAG TPA: hypothetical protein VFV38_02790 [Ktedonobacteraceae bacterium]|nr:hypothetical protein [Ktedonobacteraceae bacterium]